MKQFKFWSYIGLTVLTLWVAWGIIVPFLVSLIPAAWAYGWVLGISIMIAVGWLGGITVPVLLVVRAFNSLKEQAE